MISRFFLAAFFLLAGLNHFRAPESYLGLMPPFLRFHRELVLLSGALEIAGGIGVLVRQTRRIAGIGLVFLLLAVFPANIYAAFSGLNVGGASVPSWLLWARLPLQIPLLWWVWHAAVRRKHGETG